jgi:hypothetical protein|eukprot:COSAG01_NODE_1301_length_10829_cov_20.185182_10_plen_44_part_00
MSLAYAREHLAAVQCSEGWARLTPALISEVLAETAETDRAPAS